MMATATRCARIPPANDVWATDLSLLVNPLFGMVKKTMRWSSAAFLSLLIWTLVGWFTPVMGQIRGLTVPDREGPLRLVVPVGTRVVIAMFGPATLNGPSEFFIRSEDGEWKELPSGLALDPTWKYEGVHGVTSNARYAWFCFRTTRATTTNRVVRIDRSGNVTEIPPIPRIKRRSGGLVRLLWLEDDGLVAVWRADCDSIETCEKSPWLGAAEFYRQSGSEWVKVEPGSDLDNPVDLLPQRDGVRFLSESRDGGKVILQSKFGRNLQEAKNANVQSFSFEGSVDHFWATGSGGSACAMRVTKGRKRSVHIFDFDRGELSPSLMKQGESFHDALLLEDGRFFFAVSQETGNEKRIQLREGRFEDARRTITWSVDEVNSTVLHYLEVGSVKLAMYRERPVIHWHWVVVGI